jgi:hypothetical protein
MFRFGASGNADRSGSNTFLDFVSQVQRDVQRGMPISAFILAFINFEVRNRNLTWSQCQPLLLGDFARS